MRDRPPLARPRCAPDPSPGCPRARYGRSGHHRRSGHFFRTVREDNRVIRCTSPVVQVAADPARLHDQFPPIPLERTTTTVSVNGTVSMAHNARGNSATSSFFICIGDQPVDSFGAPATATIKDSAALRRGGHRGSGDLASAREWSSPSHLRRNCLGISRFPRA